ncbi:glycosyltransferase [Oricola sp.]|uniref:glycosyltransferase n=1 Tax=Oricola sp. TaxID=1979950 RepID=UPI00320BE563|nr:glycosyltransferase family 4 protein [Oricola sp.]
MDSSRNFPSAVIISKDNGYGLTVDAKLLAHALAELEIRADIARPGDRRWLNRLMRRRTHDFIFHLERVYPSWIHAGAANVLIPNQERFPRRHTGRLKGIDLVLTKTAHACEIFSSMGSKTTHVGFMSQDRHDPSIGKDWRRFLHVAGGSTLKGTADVISLWNRHPEWPDLTLVQKEANIARPLPPNVKVAPGFLSEDQLALLMNDCGVHLCPSRSEGWGHYIHEALGCGAVVITTDAPPMNEFVNRQYGVVVETERSEMRHLGRNYYVNVPALEAAIESLLTIDKCRLEEMGRQARRSFLESQKAFHERLGIAIADLSRDLTPRPAPR